MQSLGTNIESTDDLDNLKVGASAMNKDGNEWAALNLGTETKDSLENLSTDAGVEKHDGDEHTNFGIKFSFDV